MTASNDRVMSELTLLQSIYPDEVNYDEKASELRYKSANGAFTLRLPDGYLTEAELPTLLSAHVGLTDVSETLRESIAVFARGEEILDMVASRFEQIVADVHANGHDSDGSHTLSKTESDISHESKCTMIVWLHHLLNTNKRKQVLQPAEQRVSGVSKPGYPGVLVFSGPAAGVRQHVDELKGLNWAAFQVRLEADCEWLFKHGQGVTEVEAMGEVVTEVGEANKNAFLEAMKMKG